MGIADLVQKYPRYLYEGWKENNLEGLWYGIRAPIRYPLGHAMRIAGQKYVQYIRNPGNSIWSHDWDVLIILDACRVDLLHEVKEDYNFISGIDTHKSLASMSRDWISRNFSDKYAAKVNQTAYVTGNPFSTEIPSEFEVLDEVWKYAWDEELQTIPPRPLTDRAIDIWRNEGPQNMIVHYMQPHGPFLTRPELGEYGTAEDFGSGFGRLWEETGHTISESEVWEAYRENLEVVLDDVELLLTSIDANKIAISADHGNCVGEWGVYGHPDDTLLNKIRQVPWVTTKAKNSSGYQPDLDYKESVSTDVSERLHALGYT